MSTSENELTGLIEEYRALKSEIQNAQERRMQIVSLTVGAIGLMLSISASTALNTSSPAHNREFAIAIGGAIASYAILIPSLIMLITTQQTIYRLGEYIRLYLEPNIPGMKWESTYFGFRKKYGHRPGGLPSIYQFLGVLPMLIPIYLLVDSLKNWPLMLIPTTFWIWSLYLTLDFVWGWSKGWKRSLSDIRQRIESP